MPSTTDRVIADRYALQSTLGRGAMGTVWLAQDSLLKRRVAVKEIDMPPGFDAEQRGALEARLLREARAAARLSHPGVVNVYDVVEDEDRPWIVMEYVDAPTLADKVERDGPMDPAEVARIGIELLGILEAAHELGIVHRDVKPGNVMCTDDGRVKLADFGIASIQDDPKITQTGLVLGSPAFMAPEQASTGRSGPEADLWSLGATLYHAAEGRPPFDKGAALPTLTAVIGEEPRPMERAGALEPLIGALLEKDPSARPSIPVARARLEEVVAGDVSGAPPPRGLDTKATTAAATVLPPTELESRPVRVPDVEPQRAARPAPARRQPVTRTAGSDRSWMLWAALALGIAALIAVPLLLRDAPREAPRGQQQAEDNSGSGGGNEEDSGESGMDRGNVPDDWVLYSDPATGYTLFHPPGWEQRPIAESRVDFVDPATGGYLRVEWTREPGDDVMARLEEIAAGFGDTHENYVEIDMFATEFQGYPAGLWEYTYEDGDAPLHAYNLQFVIGDAWGFALNLNTHEEDWEASQDLWGAFQEGFRPPP